MAFKKFSPELHAQYDYKGKQAAKKYFETLGYFVKDGTVYGVDLILCQPVAYVEVEVRTWIKPFDTIHVAERKRKLLNLDLPAYLFACNKDLSKAFIGKSADILASPLIEVENKYLERDEKFFDVPTHAFEEVVLV